MIWFVAAMLGSSSLAVLGRIKSWGPVPRTREQYEKEAGE